MSTSEFKFYCSHCDQPLKCDPCYAGRQIQCPGCQHVIRIASPPPRHRLHPRRAAIRPHRGHVFAEGPEGLSQPGTGPQAVLAGSGYGSAKMMETFRDHRFTTGCDRGPVAVHMTKPRPSARRPIAQLDREPGAWYDQTEVAFE